MRLRLLLLTFLLTAGCGGPTAVAFVDGRCTIDGAPATQAQVESTQSSLSRRTATRQPFFIVITVIVVAAGAASTVQKGWLVIAARQSGDAAVGERARTLIERYRRSPLRFALAVGGTLTLLLAAGGGYVYLDLDKRATDRALRNLQFCHLALANDEEHDALAEQRRNLEAIQTTATAIRDLVDRLPADDQARAQRAVASLGAVLGRQSRLVSLSAQRAEANAKLIRSQERPAKSAPSRAPASQPTLRDLAQQIQALGGKVDALDASLKRSQGGACPPCPALGKNP